MRKSHSVAHSVSPAGTKQKRAAKKVKETQQEAPDCEKGGTGSLREAPAE
jgi:hypothetical protein